MEFSKKHNNNLYELILTREFKTKTSIFGTLQIRTPHGSIYFSTVENSSLNIPTGCYTISNTFSPRFTRSLWQIDSVAKRSGIRFHEANTGLQLEGCIALGVYNPTLEPPHQVFHSVLSMKIFERELPRFQTHTLYINEEYAFNPNNNNHETSNNQISRKSSTPITSVSN
jgi:hypothetical protein